MMDTTVEPLGEDVDNIEGMSDILIACYLFILLLFFIIITS